VPGARREIVVRKPLAIIVLAFALVAAACAADEPTTPSTTTPGETSATETGQATETPSVDPCATETLNLLNAGQLTIGTDNPAFQPWFAGTGTYDPWEAQPNQGTGNPASGEGFEGAFAYALAAELGFTEDQVVWVPITFNESFRPGPKDFDFDINEISFNENRAEAVDFSESYYDVAPALVANEGTPITEATTFEDLKAFKLGAQIGTTSLEYIEQNIQPDQQPSVYDRSVDVIAALNAGQIDGYVTDAPTAYVNVLIGQAENGVVVGQFPAIGAQEYFGLVFEKGNPLVECVNLAIQAMKADGTLEELESTWLEDVTFPEFQQ
jgi:polar amino acid transport system substrate-binding protein